MNNAVIGEYKQVINSANAYASSLVTEVNSVKGKTKNTSVIDKTLKWIDDLKNQMDTINKELDEVKNSSKSGDAVNENVIEEAFHFGKKNNTADAKKGNQDSTKQSSSDSKSKLTSCNSKINKIIKDLSTLTNHVTGLLISTGEAGDQKSAQAMKSKMDKRYGDISAMWDKVKDPAKLATESASMAQFTCAIFEAIINDLIPCADGLKILNEAEERLDKINSMKLSIYEAWQGGSITEEQRNELLDKL